MTRSSEELNAAIREAERAWQESHGQDVTDTLFGLGEDAKPVMYYGWFWRDVDFDGTVSLAVNSRGVTGFCENNKWGLPEFALSADEQNELIRLIERALDDPTLPKWTAVNAYMRVLGAPHVVEGGNDGSAGYVIPIG